MVNRYPFPLFREILEEAILETLFRYYTLSTSIKQAQFKNKTNTMNYKAGRT